jgi:hypothetical protein
MNDIRLTRRGKIVVAVGIIALIVGFIWLTSGKALACDWRYGYEPCKIVKIAP